MYFTYVGYVKAEQFLNKRTNKVSLSVIKKYLNYSTFYILSI